jgi:surface antigen
MLQFSKIKKFLVLVVATVLIAGCDATGGPKQTGGTLVGAVGGALVGSQFGKGHGRVVATALGTLIGSQIGASIGRGMDENDKRMANNNAVQALEHQPDNQVSGWHNPNNNHRGNFMVTRTQEYPQSNKVCRDYVQTVIIDGQSQKLHGRACRDVRDARGGWYTQE